MPDDRPPIPGDHALATMLRTAVGEAVAPLQKQIEAQSHEIAQLRLTVNRGTMKYRKADAATRLGISVRTLESRIAEKRIVAVREGGVVFVTENECARYEADERAAA